MDFLGVGPLELLFVLIIALIVLGPRDIARFARRAGRLLNRLYNSEVWGTIHKASQEFRDLPNRLAREAALDELDESIRRSTDVSGGVSGSGEGANPALDAWTPSPKTAPADGEEHGGENGAPAEHSEQETEDEAD